MGQVVKPVFIKAGESDSTAVFAEQYKMTAIVMPAGWDTAQITIRAAFEENGTYEPCFSRDGGEYVVITAAGRYVPIVWTELAGLRWIRLRSGVNSTPVNQTADRALTILFDN